MMELEFDKEIDAMLRKAGRSGVLVGDTAKLHLAADAINAFAENALPEKSRRIYTEHLAECDPCRKTLSSLILMNAEAEPALAAALPAPTVLASIPWYRKLFTTPNLAYTFGGLILLFGGLIGFVVFQNVGSGTDTVTQVTDTQKEFMAPANVATAATSNNSAANISNAPSNAVGEIPRSVGITELPSDPDAAPALPPPPMPMTTSPSAGSASNTAASPIVTDGVAVASGQPPPKDLAKAKADEGRLRVEEKRALNEQEVRKQDAEANSVQNRQLNRNQMPGAGNSKDSVGPNRSSVQRDNRAYDDAASMKANKLEAPAAAPDAASDRRTVGGKTFEFKQGAWYDTAFRGQATINVRRGTEEYRKLDGGLRSIAENISGLVVIVWGGKSYRIQ